MMKLGCIGALTERGSQFIGDLMGKGGAFACNYGESTWADGAYTLTPRQRVPRRLARRTKRPHSAVTWRNYLAKNVARGISATGPGSSRTKSQPGGSHVGGERGRSRKRPSTKWNISPEGRKRCG